MVAHTGIEPVISSLRGESYASYGVGASCIFCKTTPSVPSHVNAKDGKEIAAYESGKRDLFRRGGSYKSPQLTQFCLVFHIPW